MTIGYWTWWLAAVALAVAEIIMPGAALLWIGVAAAVVGLVLFVEPDLPLTTQLLVFAVGTLAAIIGARVWLRLRSDDKDDERDGEDHPHLNRRAEQYLGTVHRLESAIVNGRGRARVDDGSWAVECAEDLPTGSDVRVTGVNGVILKVEKAEAEKAR